MIKVLVIDETALMGSILASLISEEADLEAVGYVTTRNEATQYVNRVDVVVVNVNLPDKRGMATIKTLIKTRPDIKIIVSGLPESKYIILKYMEAGAMGYVLKNETTVGLLKNIRFVHEDKSTISPEMAALLMRRVTHLMLQCNENDIEPGEAVNLTDRELEVLELIAQGLNNKVIADRLFIEPGTVKNHAHKIFKKLNVKNRQEAIAYLSVAREGQLK